MSHIYNLNSVYLWRLRTPRELFFHSTKMVADKSAENTPNAQIAAKLTAQDQKFGILIKKFHCIGRP